MERCDVLKCAHNRVIPQKDKVGVIEFHSEPIVETCDVCMYASTYELDCGYEHARTNVATAWLIEDLSEVDSLPLRSLAVSAAGVEPGPVHRLEPRHWFWAMWFEPGIRISLRKPSND